jgi:hypothetical protein
MKRIRELAEQCYEYSEIHSGMWFNKEKFAELIVRECAIIVGSMEEPHQEIAQLVKEHFGVEE